MSNSCPTCAASISESARFCPDCGTSVSESTAASKGHSGHSEIQVPWKKVLALAGVIGVGFCAFFHIVWINGLPVPVKRLSPGFSEPMSDIQAISNMPWIAATSKYPLTVKALQTAGYLESDAARKSRIEAEFQTEMDSQMKKLRQEYGF